MLSHGLQSHQLQYYKGIANQCEKIKSITYRSQTKIIQIEKLSTLSEELTAISRKKSSLEMAIGKHEPGVKKHATQVEKERKFLIY